MEEGAREQAAGIPQAPKSAWAGTSMICHAVVQREHPNHRGAESVSVVMVTRGRGCKVACLKADSGFCPIFLQVFSVDVACMSIWKLSPLLEKSCLLPPVTTRYPEESGSTILGCSLLGLQTIYQC